MACDAGFADELEEWWDGLTAEEQESARACVKLLDSSGIRKIDAMSGQIGPALQDPDRKPQKPDHTMPKYLNGPRSISRATQTLTEVHPKLAESSAARTARAAETAGDGRGEAAIKAYKSTGLGWQTPSAALLAGHRGLGIKQL